MAKAKLAMVAHATVMVAQTPARRPNSVHEIPQTNAEVTDTPTAAIASGSAESTLGQGNIALHSGNETGPTTMRARSGNAKGDTLSVQPMKSYASAARDKNGENRDPNSEGTGKLTPRGIEGNETRPPTGNPPQKDE
ncbi:hypothetical protein MTO96_037910 [Rhipicephalus appendiculatus]